MFIYWKNTWGGFNSIPLAFYVYIAFSCYVCKVLADAPLQCFRPSAQHSPSTSRGPSFKLLPGTKHLWCFPSSLSYSPGMSIGHHGLRVTAQSRTALCTEMLWLSRALNLQTLTVVVQEGAADGYFVLSLSTGLFPSNDKVRSKFETIAGCIMGPVRFQVIQYTSRWLMCTNKRRYNPSPDFNGHVWKSGEVDR